ncbi:hypothetical protein [Staphylococcus equorum]|uniref:Uncharacterized protein n=1 Tax=Staphylococcus equorum TaxID=246432 RepID=A0AAP7LV33_9STAP|nr:hypothetical protein [Staphylococcus equorum]OEK58940.1 hypothetical protein ASS94_01035 [Staphylococcus equorum]
MRKIVISPLLPSFVFIMIAFLINANITNTYIAIGLCILASVNILYFFITVLMYTGNKEIKDINDKMRKLNIPEEKIQERQNYLRKQTDRKLMQIDKQLSDEINSFNKDEQMSEKEFFDPIVNKNRK